MEQLSREQAIAIADGGAWQYWTDAEVVKFQLFQRRLCLPFDRFQQAVEAVLGRPVWTHEFADRDKLIAEYEKRRPTPTIQEILTVIPAEKVIIVRIDPELSC